METEPSVTLGCDDVIQKIEGNGWLFLLEFTKNMREDVVDALKKILGAGDYRIENNPLFEGIKLFFLRFPLPNCP